MAEKKKDDWFRFLGVEDPRDKGTDEQPATKKTPRGGSKKKATPVVKKKRVRSLPKTYQSRLIDQPQTLDEIRRLEMLTKKQAARLLNVPVATIDTLRRKGLLKAKKIGRLVRFARADIDSYLEGATVPRGE